MSQANQTCYYCDKDDLEYMEASPCKCPEINLHKKCYETIRHNSNKCFYCKASFPEKVYNWSNEGLAEVIKFKNNGDTIYRYEFTINRFMEKHGHEKIYDDIRGHLIEEHDWANGTRIN